jgi:hypothetical protein
VAVSIYMCGVVLATNDVVPFLVLGHDERLFPISAAAHVECSVLLVYMEI